MHPYRTHTCGALRLEHAGSEVRLSGWLHRKRDHGNLLFLDLRDHYGLTQCVIDSSHPQFEPASALRLESVITVTGTVVARTPETINDKLPTGRVELKLQTLAVQSHAEPLPLQVNAESDAGEEVRLRYRFLDLRREKMQRNIALRSGVIASIRRRMIEQGFAEFQTPILTASSPEGARDFLVPSRLHPGTFYAHSSGSKQLSGEAFRLKAGLDMPPVAYKGAAPMMTDLLGGQVKIGFDEVLTSMQQIKAGKVIPLATTGSTRWPALPDVPTIAEQGEALAGFEVTGWFGLLAPAGTPRDIVMKLHAAVTRAVNDPEVKKRFLDDGAEITASATPEEFGNLVRAEVAKWAKVVKDAGIKVE